MGGKAITRLLDLLNYSSQIHQGDALLDDLWGRGCHSSGHWIPHSETSSFIPSNNDRLLKESLDLIEEQRENAMVQLAYYQHKLKQWYDANVKLRPLTVGDLVLRNVQALRKTQHRENWGPTGNGHIVLHQWPEWVHIILKMQKKRLCHAPGM